MYLKLAKELSLLRQQSFTAITTSKHMSNYNIQEIKCEITVNFNILGCSQIQM